MKQKLETETENRNGNATSVVVNQMLVFLPRHPSPLLTSSCSVMCSLGSLFMFSAALYHWCSILSN